MKELWKGNHAMAEAAVRAGLKFYVGYPITPQSPIVEYMSERMPELGRVFIQSESELISVNCVLGAGLTGYRSMVSSSSVGTSLMQEGITACFAKGVPFLLINENRAGCGMGAGAFAGSQDDYLRDTRGGGNGDYRLVVYMPSSIQEAVDLIYGAFDVAEKYRTPVEIMTEGRLGQMMEPVEFPEFKEITKLPWGIDGTTKPMPDYPAMTHPWEKYRQRIADMEENEQRWENYRLEDAEVVVVAACLCSRMCRGVIDELREEGLKIGMLRPITAWPFPVKGFEALPDTVKKIANVEVSNAGQMIEDVLITGKRVKKLNNVPIYSFNKNLLMSDEEIKDFLRKVYHNEAKEVG